MKRLLVFLIFLSISTGCALFAQHTLTVEITGIKKIKGNLMLALFDSEESYVSNKYTGKIVKVKGNSAMIVIEGLKEGKYAISVFQDENENGKMDTRLFGIPKEKYGFSNNINASKIRRQPTFLECGFEVKEDKQIVIKLI